MARGGLDEALAARSLDAAARLRIAADAAAGLAYLHSPGGGLAPMLHRDVKSSNVLLDAGLRARVSDVGLARPQHGATMTAGVGTFGYLDPEYCASGGRPAAGPACCSAHMSARLCREMSSARGLPPPTRIACLASPPAGCTQPVSRSARLHRFVFRWRSGRSSCRKPIASLSLPRSPIAPARARAAGEYTPASDVFSLGVVLLELLTGAPPLRLLFRPAGA